MFARPLRALTVSRAAPQPRHRTAMISGLSTAALVAVAMAVPVPYVSQQPGPTFDTLSSVNDVPLIEIEGEKTYPTDGELRLTTVAVFGGPGYPMNASGLLAAWFDPDAVVVPLEQYYPPSATQEQVQERANLEMRTSQTDAAVAALEEVGIMVPTTLTVSYVDETGPAHGVIQDGDVLVSLTHDGTTTQIADFAVLSKVLAGIAPGSEITLTVTRDGAPTDLTLTTGSRHERDTSAGLPADDDPDGSVLGVGLQPDAHLPFDVTYQIDNVGGPSAGLMFALATVDMLTPGPMTGGQHIAGTGTIALDGKVGAIGGIRQKVVGAKDDGATYFLVPQPNCAELAGHVPAGIQTYAVETLADARAVVEAIGAGDSATLESHQSCGG